MPVQIISLPLITSSLGHHHNDNAVGGSSSRYFNVPRIKAAATTFLRHGHLTPSLHQLQHHNKHVLGSSLPDEVAHRIFLACARLSLDDFCPNHRGDTSGNESGSDSGNHSGWSWLTITYVCSSWRLQALNCSLLWSYIDFTTSKHHTLTWARAKTSPLHVISPVTEQTLPLLHRTLQLAHRVKEVNLSSTSIGHVRPLIEILALNPNPALESLTVDVRVPVPSGADNDFMNTYDAYYDPLLIPTAGPPLRRLTYMELRGAPFYLLTLRCTFLTHFHLHNLPTTERPTLRHFLLMLEQLTRLRHLTLDRAFPIGMDLDNEDRDPSNQSSSTSLNPISLPRLESIILIGSVSEIANILRWIVIPLSARLIGTICTLSGLQKNVWRLTEALGSHYWDGNNSSLDALVLTGHEFAPRFTEEFKVNTDFRQAFRIRGFKANFDSSSASSQGCSGAAIDLTISPEFDSATASIKSYSAYPKPNLDPISSSNAGIITALNAIWKALSLFRVKTLILHDVDIITQKTWSQFLRTLPSLRVLHITGRAPSGLVWALLLNAISPSPSPSSSSSGTTSASDSRKALSLALGKMGRCDGGGDALIRDLKDIYLHNVDCSSGGFMVAPVACPPINSPSDLDDSRFIDVLVAALRYRRFTFGGGGDGGSGGGGAQALFLRSVSILRRCSYVPKKAVEDLMKAVPGLSVVCEFGRDALINEGEEAADGARYWGSWVGDRSADDVSGWKLRHYHRLRTLVGLGSDFS